jgi:tetratricopeptide (TPR) repeat protein
MPPIGDDAREGSPLDPLRALATVEVVGVSTVDARALQQLFERIDVAVDRGDAFAQIAPSIDSALSLLDRYREKPESLETHRAIAERLDLAAREHAPVERFAGWAWMLLGRLLYNAYREPEALAPLERAMALLAGCDGPGDRNRATVAAKYHIVGRAIAGDIDGALDELSRFSDQALRARDPILRDRVLGIVSMLFNVVVKPRPEQALALARMGLAVDRFSPSVQTWRLVLDCNNSVALALRKLGRNEEALEACRASEPFIARADDAEGKISAAWVLCEGAFIASDLLARPADALPFIASLRRVIGASRDPGMLAELAYGVAMEANCCYLLARTDDGLRACDEAIALAERAINDATAQGAFIAAHRVKGQLLVTVGRISEAREGWSLAAKRFADSDNTAIRDEVAKVRQLLAS